MNAMPRKSAPKPDLTRRYWTVAALSALAQGGIGEVRVERLASALKVSKGSFYWHFKDRADLLGSLLDLWDADFTRQLIDNAAAPGRPEQRLRLLAKEALASEMLGVDAARAEAAMQAWAAVDGMAAARLRKVEAARVGYLVEELTAAGLAEASAKHYAKALYLALIGLYAARAYNRELADDDAYLALVNLILERR